MFDVKSVSSEKKTEGVWREFGGGEFLIAHSSNLSFQRAFARLQRPHRKQIDRKVLDPKLSTTILCRAMAEGLLLDWKNVGSGEDLLEYSVDIATKVLESNEDLRDFVQDVSLDLDEYKDAEITSAEKS